MAVAPGGLSVALSPDCRGCAACWAYPEGGGGYGEPPPPPPWGWVMLEGLIGRRSLCMRCLWCRRLCALARAPSGGTRRIPHKRPVPRRTFRHPVIVTERSTGRTAVWVGA